MTTDEFARRVAGDVPRQMMLGAQEGISLSGAVQNAVRKFAQEYAEECMQTMDELLRKVHERLGLGVDIQTFADGTVEIRWKRAYGDDGWAESDERLTIAEGEQALSDALKAVLAREDEEDAKEEV